MDDRNTLPSIPIAQPEKREEVILYLRELAADDPLETWRNEGESGLVSDIDQVFHFFFDDNDFDEGAIGESLTGPEEIASIDGVKSLLDAMLSDLPDGDGSAFVNHALWPRLREQAREALNLFGSRD